MHQLYDLLICRCLLTISSISAIYDDNKFTDIMSSRWKGANPQLFNCDLCFTCTYAVDWLVLNVTFSSISAISWREHIHTWMIDWLLNTNFGIVAWTCTYMENGKKNALVLYWREYLSNTVIWLVNRAGDMSLYTGSMVEDMDDVFFFC